VLAFLCCLAELFLGDPASFFPTNRAGQISAT
jgi:hypothetical protein